MKLEIVGLLGPDARRWFFMYTPKQPAGFLIHLKKVWSDSDHGWWVNGCKNLDDYWAPSQCSLIRPATLEEFQARMDWLRKVCTTGTVTTRDLEGATEL